MFKIQVLLAPQHPVDPRGFGQSRRWLRRVVDAPPFVRRRLFAVLRYARGLASLLFLLRDAEQDSVVEYAGAGDGHGGEGYSAEDGRDLVVSVVAPHGAQVRIHVLGPAEFAGEP